MEFKNVQGMSLEEKKAYLQELIAERDRIASGEILRKQSGGLEAAAEALMPYDPMSAFNIMDKKTKTDIDRQELLLKASGDSKTKLLNEMKALTYAIQTSKDPAQIELLSTQLSAINKEYLDKFGAGTAGGDVGDPEVWFNDYIKNVALDSYGVNADGTITNTSTLISDLKSAARKQGFTAYANSTKIDDKVKQINSDRSTASGAKSKAEAEKLDIASKKQQLTQQQKDNIYKNIDAKYVGLREKDIPQAIKVANIIRSADDGSVSSRNNAVKALSRFGSDEALSESDFGRALGRTVSGQILSGLLSKVNANLPITEQEWKTVRNDIVSAVNALATRRRQALNEFTPVGYKGELLERVPDLSKAYKGTSSGSNTSKTGAGSAELDKLLGVK